MRTLNDPPPDVHRRPFFTAQESPRLFHTGEHVVAYYPTDMELREVGVGEHAPTRSLAIPKPPRTAQDFTLSSLVIFPTERCNLACDYCYLRQLGKRGVCAAERCPDDLIHDRTVCRALDVVARRGHKLRLCLFGGEPMLAWGRCRWVVERAEQLCGIYGKHPGLHITTNGTLVTPERAAFLKEHGFSLIVSLDGPREVHDRCRRYPDGRGSHEDVMRGLGYLRDAELKRRITLRATFRAGETPEGFVERLDYLNTFCDDGFGGAVAVEPATGCCNVGCADDPSGYEPGAIMAMFDAGVTWAVKRARRGERVRWAHLNKTLRRLVQRDVHWTECGAAKGTFGTSPNGKMYVCHHLGYEIGNAIDELDRERAQPWFENRLHIRKPCSICWARHLCGGGCRMEGWYLTGKPERGPVGCATSKARATAAIRVLAELADEPEVLALIAEPEPGSGDAVDEFWTGYHHHGAKKHRKMRGRCR